jgi:N-formylglutamate amidohydrolase
LPGPLSARVVVGDRFGHSAGGRLVHRLEAEIATAGYAVALNTPYPGGHILGRHGCPQDGIHAIQIEIDRTLYLDAGFDAPGKGLDTTAALLRRLCDAAADELLGGELAIAAE